MAKPTVHDAWIIELDEYHPDPRVAARYADQEARLSARRYLTDRIKKLLNKQEVEPLTSQEAAELQSLCYHLDITNDSIEDFEKEEAIL